MSGQAQRALPRVRRPPTRVATTLPRWWMHGSALFTHSSNALNLLFPAGERFFIRSVKAHLAALEDDPELMARARAFFGQEAQHGLAHEALEEVLEAQGFEVASFLEWYQKVAYGWLEPRVPPRLCLSVTVALEHLTATLAEQAITDPALEEIPAELRDLLRWHAAEEIEHKSVAFDVLRKVDDGYLLRVSGMALAVSLLLFFWGAGRRHLLAQEPTVTRSQLRRELREGYARGQNRDFLRRAFVSYLRPGFHPDDVPNDQLARDWLQAHGLAAS